jgi:ABC-type antimicrobial peptide transport system permease subunit
MNFLKKHKRVIRTFLIGISIIVVVSFIAALCVSKMYWGYFIDRPKLDNRVQNINKITSFTPILSEINPDGRFNLVVNSSFSMEDEIARCRNQNQSSQYYCSSGRILIALDDLGLLPKEDLHMTPDQLTSLYTELDSAGLLESGKPGYDRAKELRGIVLEAETKDGQTFLLVSAHGGQVSNDHYPYYEFSFSKSNSEASPVLLSSNQYYYDVAGMEGAEWQFLWVVFFVIGFCAFLIILILFNGVISIKRLRLDMEPKSNRS